MTAMERTTRSRRVGLCSDHASALRLARLALLCRGCAHTAKQLTLLLNDKGRQTSGRVAADEGAGGAGICGSPTADGREWCVRPYVDCEHGLRKTGRMFLRRPAMQLLRKDPVGYLRPARLSIEDELASAAGGAASAAAAAAPMECDDDASSDDDDDDDDDDECGARDNDLDDGAGPAPGDAVMVLDER